MSGLGSLLFGSGSKQQQTSETTSQGEQASSSFGVSGSGSTSTSASSGASQSSQDVFLSQLFSQIYGGATTAAAGVDTADISKAGSQLFSGGLNFLDRLGGGAGADELAARANGSDTSGRDAQLGVLQSQLGDFFNKQLLPGITSRGVSTGTLGGSRDAVELGEATNQIGKAFSTGAASIISNDQAARDAAAGKFADVTNQGAAAGLSSLSSLYGLAQGGATAALTPYQILSQIIGGPTVLGNSSSTQDAVAQALSSSFSNQGSSSYGFDTSSTKSQGNAVGGTQGLVQAFLGGGGGGGLAALIPGG